jgi:hypothetical protein
MSEKQMSDAQRGSWMDRDGTIIFSLRQTVSRRCYITINGTDHSTLLWM